MHYIKNINLNKNHKLEKINKLQDNFKILSGAKDLVVLRSNLNLGTTFLPDNSTLFL